MTYEKCWFHLLVLYRIHIQFPGCGYCLVTMVSESVYTDLHD